MKNWFKIMLVGFSIIGSIGFCQAQDYNDIGRTKDQEFETLKFNGYKIASIASEEDGVDSYSAIKKDVKSNYINVINIDKVTGLVVGVTWRFNFKDFMFIKSLLVDMVPTDSSYSELENKVGKAKLTKDLMHRGYGKVIWNKKAINSTLSSSNKEE